MRTSNFDKNDDIYLDVTNSDFGFFDFKINQTTKENLNKALNFLLEWEYETFYKLFDDKLFSELKEDLLLDYLNEIKTDAISIFEYGSKFINDQSTLIDFFTKKFIIQYTDLRLEKYNSMLQDVVMVMIDDRPYKETLELIKTQIDEFDRKINNSLMSGKDPDALQLNLVKYLNRVYNRLQSNLINNTSLVDPDIKKIHTITEADLSAFEIALKHWYLVESGIEQNITSILVAEKYKHLKSSKNIEMSYNDIFLKRKIANKKQLLRVLKSLKEYPNVQKAIENDLDKI